jgi:hypothetical protein
MYPSILGTFKLPLTAVRQGVNFFFRIRVLALYNTQTVEFLFVLFVWVKPDSAIVCTQRGAETSGMRG